MRPRARFITALPLLGRRPGCGSAPSIRWSAAACSSGGWRARRSAWDCSGRRRGCAHSARRYLIDLRRADEVVFGEPADGVRRKAHVTVAVAHRQIRVVVLDVGQMRHCVDETHRMVEVAKAKFASQRLVILDQVPIGRKLLKSALRLLARIRGHSALTGSAAFLAEGSATQATLSVLCVVTASTE